MSFILAGLAGFNAAAFWWGQTWLKWLNLLACVFCLAALVHNLASSDECKDAPKVVEFRQGMTLCPGQSATFSIQPNN